MMKGRPYNHTAQHEHKNNKEKSNYPYLPGGIVITKGVGQGKTKSFYKTPYPDTGVLQN